MHPTVVREHIFLNSDFRWQDLDFVIHYKCASECAHVYTFLSRESDKSNPAFFFDKFFVLCYYIDVEVIILFLNLFRKTRWLQSSGFFFDKISKKW